MTARYRLDPHESRFTVQAFAAGMLGFLGHSPTFAVRDFSGEVTVEGSVVTSVTLTVRAMSLRLTDEVNTRDRDEIERTMFRDVLETAHFPEIGYAAANVTAAALARGRYRLRIAGWLSLRDVTRQHPVDAELLVFDDGIRLRGETSLRLSEYRIRPVTALGGMIRLQDDVRLSFDLAGLPEGS
jgi:polyisoprenoid-binding protein YceI